MRMTAGRLGVWAWLAVGVMAGGAWAQPAEAPPIEGVVDEFAAMDVMRRFGVATPPIKGEGTIRLATYNIENLFDDIDDPALSGDNEDIDDTKPEHECRAVARAIRRLDADILCLQEIENRDALLAFRDTYLDGMGYDHVVSIDAGDERGIEQAVLSRFPLTNARNWPGKPLEGVHPEKYGNNENWLAGQPLAFRRSPLVVEATVPAGARGNAEDYTLTLVVVHHKSGGPASYWREAEARGVLGVIGEITAADPEANVALLGDFNAQVSDASVRAYLEAGFIDVHSGLSGPEGVSHESQRRIDLVLVNAALAAEIVEGSGFILGTPARPVNVDWRQVPTFEGYAADHYPVAIDLRPVEGGAASASGHP